MTLSCVLWLSHRSGKMVAADSLGRPTARCCVCRSDCASSRCSCARRRASFRSFSRVWRRSLTPRISFFPSTAANAAASLATLSISAAVFSSMPSMVR